VNSWKTRKSRTEFNPSLLSRHCILTPPPILHRRVSTPTRNNNINGSRETLMSERSFIVVHNTLRVAWEKEMYHERILEEQQKQQKGHQMKNSRFRWHSLNSSCTESSGSTDGLDTDGIFDTNRISWNHELDKIVRLD
jgi:hypothetical protein